MGRFKPSVMERNGELLYLLEETAKNKEATMAQIALAWISAKYDFMVPIPGTTKTHRLEENLGAASIKFTQLELKQFEQVLSTIEMDETHF